MDGLGGETPGALGPWNFSGVPLGWNVKVIPMTRTFSAWSALFFPTVLFSVLSYVALSPAFQAALFLLGGGACLWVSLRSIPEPRPGARPAWDLELWGKVPGWVLGSLFLLTLFIRFYRLDTLFLWPGKDEADLGMFAISLSEKWDWRFFYTFGQVPPTPIWASALLLKAGIQAPLCLWIPSAIVSTLTALVAWAAARTFFSRSTALVLGALFILSFWPFLMGRICHQGVWVPLWACLCLLFLGRTLRARAGRPQDREALALGLVTGSGCWTFTPWPAVALAVGLGLWRMSATRGNFQRVVLGRFLPGFLFALLPFFNAVLTEGYGQHISAMFAGSGWNPWSHQVRTVFAYISEHFWGCAEPDAAYTAPNGGLLTPVLGGFFVMGGASLWRHRSDSPSLWLVLALLLGLAPGLVSMNVETFRIAGALPILLCVTAFGAVEFANLLPKAHRRPVLAALLLLSAGVDAWRVLRWQTPLGLRDMPVADLRAMDILRRTKARYGPGTVLTEFLDNSHDESLFVLSYGFNTAENPRVSQASLWTGVVMDRHYRPFLEPHFPGAFWADLGQNDPVSPELSLGIIPLRPENRQRLERWRLAHRYFRQVSLAVNSISEPRTYAQARDLFEQVPSWVLRDPFLLSCYWEKKAQFFYDYDFKEHYEDQCDALRHALAGLPAFHLHFQLGCLLMRRGHWAEAEKELRAALAQRPGDLSVLNALRVLEDRKRAKTSTVPAAPGTL